MKRNNKKGFTIVELVIVIAVIAILAGVLIPTFSGIVKNAKESKALQEARNIYTNYLAAKNGVVEDTVYIKSNDLYFQVTGNKITEKPVDKPTAADAVIVTAVADNGTVTTEPVSEDDGE